MAFRYGCFISYPHDGGALIRSFMEDLTEALVSELGAYLDDDNKLYFDKQRLAGGTAHPAALAQAMCASACWLLVYVPKYRRKEWCNRELRAMRVLEQQRQQAFGRHIDKTQSMIIPILLRGDIGDLPRGVPETSFVVDFSKYVVGQERIVEHPEFEGEIRRLSKQIYSIFRTLEESAHPRDCHSFELPEADASDWGAETGGPSLERPL